MLDTGIGNTSTEGLVNSRPIDRTGGAIVLPDSDLTPDKVLWHAVQQEDYERKRNQQAARSALSELNNIRVNGWANHLTELNDRKNNLLTKASGYLQKYRGKSWTEFDPKNANQAKEALDIQKELSELKEMEAYSEQVKQWHSADVNAYKGKEANYDPESISRNTEFYKKPLKESYDEFGAAGERPILEQAFPDWRVKAMSAAKGVGSVGQATKREADGRIVTTSVQDVPEAENQMAFDGFLMTPQGKQALKDTSKETSLRGDELTNYIKSHYWDNFQNKRSSYGNVASAEGRKKEAAQWESSGSTLKNNKNIFTVYRRDNGTIETTISHTDPADNKPLTFMVGENPQPVVGTPVKIIQDKGGSPKLLLSVAKGNNYAEITGGKIVSVGKDFDTLEVPYDDFADVIKNEYGNGELSYYDVLNKVKGKVGSTGTGGGKSESKSSGKKDPLGIL